MHQLFDDELSGTPIISMMSIIEPRVADARTALRAWKLTSPSYDRIIKASMRHVKMSSLLTFLPLNSYSIARLATLGSV